jgi:hypothetical protein
VASNRLRFLAGVVSAAALVSLAALTASVAAPTLAASGYPAPWRHGAQTSCASAQTTTVARAAAIVPTYVLNGGCMFVTDNNDRLLVGLPSGFLAKHQGTDSPKVDSMARELGRADPAGEGLGSGQRLRPEARVCPSPRSTR